MQGLSKVFFCLIVVSVFSAAQLVQAQNRVQAPSVDNALEAAQHSGKRIAVYMHSEEWGAPSRMWDALPRHAVIEQYMSRYKVIEVDVATEVGKEWAESYNVVGMFPSLALIQSDGTPLGYLSLEAPDLIATLSFLLTTEMVEEDLSVRGR